MKKIIIITIILFGLAGSASAFYSDANIINIWKSRPDLQKAFPGDPTNNVKLETWAKKYGWKETPDLYNYYPDKAIIEKIIDSKTNSRIASLESKIEELTNEISRLQSVPATTAPKGITGTWKECTIRGNGAVVCPLSIENLRSDNMNNGYFETYFLIK